MTPYVRYFGLTKVLLVAPAPPPSGGIATWTATIMPRLARQKSIETKLVNSAVLVVDRNYRSYFFRLVEGVARGVRDLAVSGVSLALFSPDVIHVCSSAGYGSLRDLALTLMSRIFGVKVFIHFHTGVIPDYQGRKSLPAVACRATTRLAYRVFALDGETVAYLEKVSDTPVVLLPNMIDIATTKSIAASHGSPLPRIVPGPGLQPFVRLIYVGSVRPTKGLDDLLSACARIQGVRLDIVGHTRRAYQSHLQTIARLRDGGDWLTFHGPMNQTTLFRILANSDILVLPSHSEGFPYAVLEAMALGIPVVVTSVGALPDIVAENGDYPCGICVPPGDGTALGDALTRLIKRPEQRLMMGKNGTERVLAFDVDVIVPKFVAYWTGSSG
ncbi:glycosyltransferase family 4 protein [Gammaproteobacteria bacterium]|nr:glycosyltransferase family 4 protein [Gammaproteobacteria bacterium]